MRGSGIVLTHPKALTAEAMAQLRHQVEQWWDAGGRAGPLVLQEGMQASIIGGLNFRLALSEGPLDGVRFDINVPRLADLPPYFEYEGGQYLPGLIADGRQIITTDGDPVYRWEAAP